MLPNLPEVPQTVMLAMDHHQRLIEEANKHRLFAAVARSSTASPSYWQRVRFYLGTLLISVGQRLKMGATDAVWG